MTFKIKLFFEDDYETAIDCEPDEDVISAALRQRLILMSECREGVCSTCKCFLADGDAEMLSHSVYALTPREAEEGYVLACQLRPSSDLELEFDYPSSMVHRFEEGEYQGLLDEVFQVSDTVVRVTIRVLPATTSRSLTGEHPINYVPGQFARLTLANGVSRDYSMANVSNDDGRLEFFVRIYPDGEFSSNLVDHPIGEHIGVIGPRGKFILRDNEHIPVFIAGGTGFAPILAMLRQLAADRPAQPAVLIFGNTNVGDVFGGDELKVLTEQLPNLEVILDVVNSDDSWTGEVGTATEIARKYISETDRSQFEYYYCGPPKMIEATTQMLEAAGVARDLRHHEDFVPSRMEERNG
jgi:methane monooxygenase component C